ncbi:MAG: phosphate ABC transporter permease PstA [Anaerolineaceae bacterium]|nr:phosphate ABC transporter permease PstA [Anaerolineaceae bacterium]
MNQVSQNFLKNLPARHRIGTFWVTIFRFATIIGIIALAILLVTIIDDAFGYTVIENEINPGDLARDGISLDQMDKDQLVVVLEENISAGLFRRFEYDMPFEQRSREDVNSLIAERVIEPQIVHQWSLIDSIFRKNSVIATFESEYAGLELKFMSWLDWQFIVSPQSADAVRAGVRTAILGTLWTIFIAILFAFPIGVGAAIYLQEYARKDLWVNRLIQTNINNLAGVPSIIYGILGLAIFVRTLEALTSGAVFGILNPTENGRTILSAGLTLGLLILPLIIINSQEAIKAVSNSLRQASFGLGATRWQTIWHHVLPSALPGILTGTILAISRAIGETAPLVVVGASTFITVDPSGPFSKFTTLPIQIYQWTSRPQDVFRSIAAAAIIVLLIMLLSMNAIAVLLRNRYTKRI